MAKENSYKRGKEEHQRQRIQQYFDQQTRPHAGIVDFIDDEYTLIRHYMPHGLGLSGMVLVGSIAVMMYNQYTKDTFDSIYFSSW